MKNFYKHTAQLISLFIISYFALTQSKAKTRITNLINKSKSTTANNSGFLNKYKQSFPCTPTASTTTTTACDSLVWNGITYTVTGIYLDTILNAEGCDSVMTLNLTIANSSTSLTTITSCDSLWWNGTKYTASGTYTWHGTNAANCDSTATLYLTINQSTATTFTTSACGSYTWALNSKVYTNSNNTDTVHLTTVSGCDSLITLNLTILSNITDVHINGIGAFCGDTAITTLSTNINYTYGNVSYEWSRLGYNEDTWQVISHDSTIDVSITTPAQYVVKTTIAGCGTFYSNQQTVMPVKNPNVALTPTPIVEICNNNLVNFIASSADSGVNNYAFYQVNSIVQNGSTLTYNTPILTTANSGVVYTIEATNLKPTFDGNITENFWGTPLAVSTWGPSPSFGAGHELNAVYARADANNVYLAIAGNVQNQNRIMVFIDSKTGGYNNGNYGRTGLANNSIRNFNSGSIFDPGFNADYCLGIGTDATRSQFYLDLFTLGGTASGGGGSNNYIGSNLTPATGYSIGANPVNNSQTSGFEVAIPKAALGYTTGDIRIFLLYSADNGFVSNQFLTRANTGAGSYGNGIVNYALAKPSPIDIPVGSLQNSCKTSVATMVTVKPNLTSITTQSSCDSLWWNGTKYTTSGTYNFTSTGSNGCDSIATLNLTINHPTVSSTTTAACDSLSWNGTKYTTSGTYTFTSTGNNGCDSIATLNLTINHPTASSVTATACDSLWWNGIKYTSTGTYTYITSNAVGCDSTTTLILTVNNSTTSLTTQTACDSLWWNGTKYTTSGTYSYSTSNAVGCDSIATLILTVNHSSISLATQTACDSSWWNGTKYTTSGTYSYSTSNAVGCDSTATLILTVNHSSTITTTQSACDSLVWNGITYFASGIYTYSTTNATGCDSTITLNLTVNKTPAKPIIIVSSTSISAPQTGVVYTCQTVANATSYTWLYTGTGTTINNNGDSTITVDFNALATSGNIQVVTVNGGCTSAIDTIAVTVIPLPVKISNYELQIVNSTINKSKQVANLWTTATEINSKNFEVQRSNDGRNFVSIGTITAKGFANEYSFVDDKPFMGLNYYRLKQIDNDGKFALSVVKTINLNSNEIFNVSIYPNPAKNVLNITVANGDVKQVRIFNSLGKTVYTTIENRTSYILNLTSLSSGIYFVEILTNDGRREVEKFSKN